MDVEIDAGETLNLSIKLIMSFTHSIFVDEAELKDFIKDKVYWYLMDQERRQRQ